MRAVMGRKGKSNMCIMYILWPANIKEQMELCGWWTCLGDWVH